MPLQCPKCHVEIDGENVNITEDIAKCGYCGEVFRPSDELPHEDLQHYDPPSKDVIYREYASDGGVTMLLQKPGITGRSIFFFGFAAFWMLITVVVSGAFFFEMLKGEEPWPMIFFFVPFYAIGIGMFLLGCWMAWSVTAIQLAADKALVSKKLGNWLIKKEFPTANVEGFDEVIAYRQNNRPVYCGAMMANGKTVRFGVQLSTNDRGWLLDELNASLRKLQR